MSVAGDPFLVSGDTTGLRLEIKRLQTENLSLKQQAAQLKLKVEQLLSAQGASGAADGGGAGSSGSAAASSSKKKPAGAAATQASKELEAENARLKEELARTKRELAHAVQQSEKNAQTKSQHQQLLEAVSVAACEREQRLRNVAVDIQLQLQDTKRRVEELQKKLLESQAAAATAAAVVPPPPPPALSSSVAPPPLPFPIDTARNLLSALKASLHDLDACLNGAVPAAASKRVRGTTTTLRQSTTNELVPATGAIHDLAISSCAAVAAVPAPTAAAAGHNVVTESSSYSTHTASTDVATVARATPQQSALPPVAASLPVTRKRAAAAARDDGNTALTDAGGQPRQRGRRTEPPQLLPAVKAFLDAAAAASQSPAAVTANNTTGPAATSLLISPHTKRSQVNFSQDPFQDVHALYQAIPVLKRNLGVAKLAAQVALYFEHNHKALAACVVRHVAASGQQWPSSDLRKRAVMLCEVLFAAGGGELLDACVMAVRNFAQGLIATRESLQTDYRPQIAPVASFLRHLLSWRKANEAQRPSLQEKQSTAPAALYSHTPMLLLHEILVVGLRGLRRADGGSLFREELYLWEEALCWCQFLHADGGDDSLEAIGSLGDSPGATDANEGYGRAETGVALSLTLQAILGDVVAHHRPDLRSHFERACDAASWSRSLVPLATVERILTRLAVGNSSSTSASRSLSSSSPRRRNSSTTRGAEGRVGEEGSDAFESLQCLRLLILYHGLPHLPTITAAWNTTLPSPPPRGGGEAAAQRGESRNAVTPHIATALVVLVGLVAIDYQLVDDRDAEWTTTTNLLLDDATPSTYRRILPAWAQDTACLALLHMCCPTTTTTSPPSSEQDQSTALTTTATKRAVLQRLAAWRKGATPGGGSKQASREFVTSSPVATTAAATPLKPGFESAWTALEAEVVTKTKHHGGK